MKKYLVRIRGYNTNAIELKTLNPPSNKKDAKQGYRTIYPTSLKMALKIAGEYLMTSDVKGNRPSCNIDELSERIDALQDNLIVLVDKEMITINRKENKQ